MAVGARLGDVSSDRIDISGLRLAALIGALPHEREARQPLQIDLSIHADLARAGKSDALDHTVHYGDVCDAVVALVETSEFILLERMAQAIADLVLRFPLVAGVDVKVTKLRPPIAATVDNTSVSITRIK